MRESSNFERFASSVTNKFSPFICSFLDIIINNRFDVRIEIFLQPLILFAIVSQSTLKISRPFVIQATMIMPPIIRP